MTVTVGDENAGSNYQVHICSPQGTRRLDDNKSGLFVVQEWEGIDALIATMNQFIKQRTADAKVAQVHALAACWLWEYDGMAGWGPGELT